jgi:hypothetical protein
MEGAVENLEAYLRVKRVVVNLAEKWLEDDPSRSGFPLAQFLQDVGTEEAALDDSPRLTFSRPL